MSKKSQILEIIKKKTMAKSDDNKARVDALVSDLKDNNHNAQVPDGMVPSSSKKSVLYKAGMGAPKPPKSPAAALKPEGLVPPGTQAAMTAGKQNQPKLQTPTKVSNSMKPPMKKSKVLEKLKLKKADNPDAKADQELAENVEALVENHEKATEDAEEKEMEKSEAELYLQKAKDLQEKGHFLAADKLASEVLAKSSKESESYASAMVITTSIPRKDEYTPEEVAVAALAKTECMGKNELAKSKDKNKRAKEQKGVHGPAFMDSYESGTSNVGARMAPGGASKQTNEWAKEQHKEKLAELKSMPKPNLTKTLMGKPGVNRPMHSRGINETVSVSNDKESEEKSLQGVKVRRGDIAGAKAVAKEVTKELKDQPKPSLTKAHPEIDKYNAARQSEAEAKLKTPEGEAARKSYNSKILEKLKAKKAKK